jgi:hypothetical protein
MFSNMNSAVFCINFQTIAIFVTFIYEKKVGITKLTLTNPKNHLRTTVDVRVSK